MNTLNQEADMGYIKDFVSKIAEALVAATELPKQMQAIQLDLNNLNVDLEKTKSRNIELDTMLADTRRQRDEAEQALSQVKNDLSQSQATAERLDAANVSLHSTVADLEAKVQSVTKERDDYGMKQMEAEERASQAEAKLAKLAEALGLPKPEAKPVDKPAEVKPAEPAPIYQSPPPAEPTQAQPEPPKRVYEGDYNYYEISKGKPEHWDNDRRQYYVEL